MRVYKTLTEHTDGRIRDGDSPTGWKRRVGSERVVVNPTARARKDREQVRTLYEPAEAPRTVRLSEAEAAGVRGGTVRTVVEGALPMQVTLDSDEVEYLINRYVNDYDTGLALWNGVTFSTGQQTSMEGIALAMRAARRAMNLGVYLPDCDVSRYDLPEEFRARIEEERARRAEQAQAEVDAQRTR